MLEELMLNCYQFSEMTICAPNLKYLNLDTVGGHLTLCTPLLQELIADFEDTTSFSIGIESLIFHHLRTIELHCVPFDIKEATQSVIRLITGSPLLQKLQFSAF